MPSEVEAARAGADGYKTAADAAAEAAVDAVDETTDAYKVASAGRIAVRIASAAQGRTG